MTPMSPLSPKVRHTSLAGALLLAAAVVLAGCGSAPAPSPSATAPAPPTSRPATAAPEPTAVPGAGTPAPEPTPKPTKPTTTGTEWGEILDSVPDDFPVYPGADAAPDAADGPVSGAWITDAGVSKVVGWYRATLEAAGYTTQNLSDPLEDGSRVLDTVTDLPECRIQTTFRPADGSTIITVLYGAGCAAAQG